MSSTSTLGHRRTVLAVDDDRRNRAIVRSVLGETYEVIEAEDGASALERLAQTRIDLVILDVMMPDIDGFETCRRIKAMPREGFLPVVLATALDSQADRNNGLAAGADEFLTKPIDRLELTLRVSGLLRIRDQDAEIREKEAFIRRQLAELRDLQALKDDLFSLIVHDLRNPLAGVFGFVELLQQQLSDPALAKARKIADLAGDASRKLRDLLEEVLEVQRLESDGLPIQLEPASLTEIARDAARTLEGAAAAKKLGVVVRAEEDHRLELDGSLVRRALENLISNAIKFSPTGGAIEVLLKAHQDRVVLEVADRGPGIAEEVRAKLFKKFASTDAQRSGGRPRGFGLGLHLVKLVANAHGGDVFVHDHAGGGTIFGMSFVAPRT